MRTLKSTVLAIAVALTFTGYGAAAASAAPAPAETTSATEETAPPADGTEDTATPADDAGNPPDESTEPPEESTEEATEDSTEEAAEPALTVSPTTLTDIEFLEDGVTAEATGLDPDTAYTVQVTADGGYSVRPESLHSDADGRAAAQLHPATTEVAIPGTHTVEVRDASGALVAAADLTLTEEEAPAEPRVQTDRDTISVSELEADGLGFSGTGFEPHQEVVATAAYTTSGTLYLEELTADANGVLTGSVRPDGVEPEPGEVELSVLESGEGPSVLARTAFTITGDDPTGEPETEPSLTVDPTTISAERFVDAENGGVTLAVSDCAPGDLATFTVTAAEDSDVVAYEDTRELDENGAGAVLIYGLDTSRPDLYTGAYDVTVRCPGFTPLTGGFEVTGAQDGGGSGDGGGSEAGGSSMPRTGAELTGLALGAGLLALGGATLMMSAGLGRNRRIR
jgi:hypothetical protein